MVNVKVVNIYHADSMYTESVTGQSPISAFSTLSKLKEYVLLSNERIPDTGILKR